MVCQLHRVHCGHCNFRAKPLWCNRSNQQAQCVDRERCACTTVHRTAASKGGMIKLDPGIGRVVCVCARQCTATQHANKMKLGRALRATTTHPGTTEARGAGAVGKGVRKMRSWLEGPQAAVAVQKLVPTMYLQSGTNSGRSPRGVCTTDVGLAMLHQLALVQEG